jgi:hypothetical protein
MFSEQVHAWQATLDEQALVFTTHPKNEPQVGTQWPDGDGYWTGSGSLPRSAQHGTAAIHLYAPQFEKPGPPLEQFTYLDYTHAYFPQERFDEVVRDGNWTFGRRGRGYVALWSYRPVEWRALDPSIYFTHGLQEPFDLVAPGGADNVWVVEVGDARRWKSFAKFRAAVRASRVDVTVRPPTSGSVPAGFDVRYDSPTEGSLSFGWTGPLRVRGRDVAIHRDLRIDNPWVKVPFEGRRYEIADAKASLSLDFDRLRRKASARR